MITLVYGTQVSKNNAPQILSALAFETAFGLSRKTLILQFYQKHPVENLLIGKQTLVGELDDGITDDTGIETLIRKTRSKGLKEEHFTTYTKQVVSSTQSENFFDVATVAKLADFRNEIVKDGEIVRELVETASRVYNSIFILADGKDEEMITMLSKVAEKKIICVEQGNKQGVYCADNTTIYLIPNYDEESIYSVKTLKKSYAASQIFEIPYEVGFNDACKQNNILRFLYENNHSADSQTGALVKALKEIAAHLAGTSVKEMTTGIHQWDFKTLLPESPKAVKKEIIKPSDVEITKEKKHFWSRKKTVVHVDRDKESKTPEVPEKEEKAATSQMPPNEPAPVVEQEAVATATASVQEAAPVEPAVVERPVPHPQETVQAQPAVAENPTQAEPPARKEPEEPKTFVPNTRPTLAAEQRKEFVITRPAHHRPTLEELRSNSTLVSGIDRLEAVTAEKAGSNPGTEA